MKNIRLLIIALFACYCSYAHMENDPVRWKFSVVKIDDITYELHCTSIIQQPWHIYAQTSVGGLGLPTKFSFTKHPLITLDGEVHEEGQLKTQKVENAELKYYGMRVDFVQVIKLKAPSKTNI